MADFETALKNTLAHEGGFADLRPNTSHPHRSGEVVNFGINHWTLRRLGFMPDVPRETPRDVPASDREVGFIEHLDPAIVRGIYLEHYWKPFHLSELDYQKLADKVFDVNVNTGRGNFLLQRAVNKADWPSPQIIEDGIVGPKTIAAVNDVPGIIVLQSFRNEAEHYYRNIPDPYNNLAAWLKRLAAD